MLLVRVFVSASCVGGADSDDSRDYPHGARAEDDGCVCVCVCDVVVVCVCVGGRGGAISTSRIVLAHVTLKVSVLNFCV